MIRGLSGTTIFTEHSETLASFYRDVVGLPVDPVSGTDPSSGATFYVMGAPDGAKLCVGKHSEVYGRNTDPARHIASLDSDDIEVDYKRLKSAGVEFIEEPTPAGERLRIATFKDPDGNYVQLLQFPAAGRGVDRIATKLRLANERRSDTVWPMAVGAHR